DIGIGPAFERALERLVKVRPAGVDRKKAVLAGALEGAEVMQAILDDRAAERKAELVPEVIRLRRVLLFLELVEPVQRFVAEELEDLTMEIVGSALGGDRHDAARTLSELRRDLSRVYCKFPNRRLGNVVTLL